MIFASNQLFSASSPNPPHRDNSFHPAPHASFREAPSRLTTLSALEWAMSTKRDGYVSLIHTLTRRVVTRGLQGCQFKVSLPLGSCHR
jgi:hypothetical protein